MACKVDTNLMLSLVSKTVPAHLRRRELHAQKHKYCVFKNDLVMNTNIAMFPELNPNQMMHTNAYPAVVSTLADIDDAAKMALCRLYGHLTGTHFENDVDNFIKENKPKMDEKTKELLQSIKVLPYFTAQGYALGTAWASDQTGDTVSSVLVGGMQTVMNGAFACRAGEVLQWYFEFEENQFYPNTVSIRPTGGGESQRKVAASRKNVSQPNADRIYIPYFLTIDADGNAGETVAVPEQNMLKCYDAKIASIALAKTGTYDREKARITFEGTDYALCLNAEAETWLTWRDILEKSRLDNYAAKNELHTFKGDAIKKRRRDFNEKMDGDGADHKGNKFYPKPYRLYNGKDHYGDKIRIFAKCVNGGRAHEMIDIMLMTQSL